MISMFGGRPDDHPPCVSIGRRPGGVHVSSLRNFIVRVYSSWCRSCQAVDTDGPEPGCTLSLAVPRRRKGVGGGNRQRCGVGDNSRRSVCRSGGERLCRGGSTWIALQPW